MPENATINLNVNADEGLKSLRQMRQEMKDLQIAMSKTTDPAEFKKLQTQFAQLRNDIKDTSAAMQYLDPGELLGGWIKMTQGVVGAFSAITGAMSLFGSESETIQAIEKKSMVLIQTMMGLEQARQLLIDGGGRAQLKALFATTAAQYKQIAATVAQWTAQKAMNASTIAGSFAFKGLGLAMKAVPFIAVAGAIVGIVAGLINMGKKSEEVGEKTNYMADTLKQAASGASDAMTKVDIYSRNLVKAKGDKVAFAKAVKDYNDNIASKYNTSLLTTSSSLDAIARAAKEARANIWNLAVVEAGQAKMKQIWADNFDALMTYNQAQENASNLVGQLDAAQKAYDDKWKGVVYDPWQDIRGEQQQKDMEVIATLQARILNLQEKGVDSANAAGQAQSDLFKQGLVANAQIESLLNTIDVATSKITVSVNTGTTAVKETTKVAKEAVAEIKANILEPLPEDVLKDNLDQHLQYLKTLGMDDLEYYEAEKKARYDYYTDLIALKKKEYEADGVLTVGERENLAQLEKDQQSWAETVVTTNKEVKKSTIDLINKIKDQTDKYAEHINTIGNNISQIFANLTEISMIEIEKQDYAWQQSYESRNELMISQLEKAKAIWGEESERYQDLLERQKKMEEEKAAHDAKIEEDKKKASQKYAKAQLAIQMAQATASFAQGVAGAWSKSIAQLGPPGVPVAIGLTALLSGVYATQMALMAKQMGAIGKMRRGGLITGPTHEAGGVTRELEGGEAVLNSRSMSIPGVRNLASQLNELGGGVSFRDGSSGNGLMVDSDSIANAVVNAIHSIPVVVTESDITKTQKRVKVIESKTTF